jgi:hypothetical protein
MEELIEMISENGKNEIFLDRAKVIQYLERTHRNAQMADGKINWISIHLLRLYKEIEVCQTISDLLAKDQIALEDLSKSLLLVDQIVKKEDLGLFNSLARHELWPSLVCKKRSFNHYSIPMIDIVQKSRLFTVI